MHAYLNDSYAKLLIIIKLIICFTLGVRATISKYGKFWILIIIVIII